MTDDPPSAPPLSPARALACLARPSVLLAIAVLVANDHWLKHAHPSWLTGKLSDVAGLYAFPLLLTALLGAVLRPWPWAARWTAHAAFAVTSAWFAAIKLTPAAARATERLLAAASGSPASIVVDPTDLVALLVLWPAWRLCRAVGAGEPPRISPRAPRWRLGPAARRRLGITAAIAMSLATLATSPVPHTAYRVTRLAADGPTLYARLDPDDRMYPVAVYRSDDLQSRHVWSEIGAMDPGERESDITDSGLPPSREAVLSHPALPPDVSAVLRSPPELPVVACLPDEPSHCVRIDGSPHIEASNDGGQTFEVVWEVPAERAAYRQRSEHGSASLLPRPGARAKAPISPDSATHDALALPATANGGGAFVVAHGGQGLVVGRPGQPWERVGVGPIAPTPWAAATLGEALEAAGLELQLAALVAVILAARVWWRGGSMAEVGEAPRPRRSGWHLVGPAIVAWLVVASPATGWLVLAGFALLVLYSEPLAPSTLPWTLLAPGALALGAWLFVWPLRRDVRRWQAAGASPSHVRHVARSALMAGGTSLAGAWAIWLAWAFGWLPWYGGALVLSAAWLVGTAWRWWSLGSRPDASDPAPSEPTAAT